MPNGGLPYNCWLTFPDTDLMLHLDGTMVRLERILPPEVARSGWKYPRSEVLCKLSREQTLALIYHLLLIGGNLGKLMEQGVQLSYLGARLTPQYSARGCTYDY